MRRYVRFAIRLFLFAMLIAAPTARAADFVELQPTSPWRMDYAPNSCLLVRSFGTGKDQVVLRIDQFDPYYLPVYTLVGKRFGRFLMSGTSFIATFGPGLASGDRRDASVGTDGPERTPLLVLGRLDLLNRYHTGNKVRATTEEFPAPSAKQANDVTQLQFEAGSVKFVLRTGPLGPPRQAMQSCLDALVRDWGLDPAQQARLSRRVEPVDSPAEWFKPKDFPARAVAKKRGSLIRFRMMVDATGKPSSCYIQEATLTREYIDLTCKLLMERGRFLPALDVLGQPVASYYTNSVEWLL